ncbi:hypothetical protein CI109_107035 [Kwoniella shandongensis]|uniref:Uncharacterized protein n=1 Tax=Kwoniella shandongensis TaxID=1734106 RepID=A0A5M6BQK3_9TREE|nr:uncharacterized protein CI109_006443 [Kwoniella shandongensis]KAA5525174.1 hypothetical protein CI109_006443 [Kwoniella shandongensis]
MNLPLGMRDLPPHLLNSSYPSSSSPSSSSQSTPITSQAKLLPPTSNSTSKLGTPTTNTNFGGESDDPEEGTYEDEENIFRDMNWEEILEDLNARFLINLPKEEMSLVRVYWQAEQAHWFYEDYLRPLNPLLPSLSQRHFTRLIIESSPLYKQLMKDGGVDYDRVWEEYCSYKRMVPCCGGILINRNGDKCLMVRGYKSNAGWSFPRGKINLEESEEACAIREVEEETGFDLTGMIHSSDKIKTHINAQEVTMFIIKGIDEATVFETQTRNEIGAIEWVRLMDLPTWVGKRGPKRTGGQGQKKFYNVTPFVNPLKTWLKEHGINPYMKPKKAQANSGFRDLQPYQFESPTLEHASPVLTRDSSALDHLFSRFIHKQEEELEAPSQEIAVGSDNKAGLERLFGNLNVLKEEEKSISISKSPEDREREKEDYDLAKLLGSVGQTPVPEPPKPTPATQKQNNLLAMLNQRPPAQEATPQASASPVKPHQARLLSALSPNGTPPMSAPPSTSLQLNRSNQGSSSPASLGQSSTPTDSEAQRQAKARALLEMTLTGIGMDGPTNKTPHSESSQRIPSSEAQGAGYAILQQGPSGYSQQPPLAYRTIPQPPPPFGMQPRPPIAAQHDNANRNYQGQPAYDPQSQARYGSAEYQSQPHGYGQTSHPFPAPPGVNNQRPPPYPPAINPLGQQSYRPAPQPVYPAGPNNVPSYAGHQGPNLSHQGGPFAPPQHGIPPTHSILNPPFPPHLPQSQSRPPAGFPPNHYGAPPPQQQHYPPSIPAAYALAHHPPHGQVSRASPPKQNGSNPNVHHPIPRPTAGSAQGLLAMLNGSAQGR